MAVVSSPSASLLTSYGTPVPPVSSPTAAPYPIPGSSGGALPSGGTGTAAPTGTGVAPGPTGVAPFQGAAIKLGSDKMLVMAGAAVVAVFAML